MPDGLKGTVSFVDDAGQIHVNWEKEYNDMLRTKISETNNSIIRERYFTVSVYKKNIDEARTFFSRVGTEFMAHLSKLSSVGEELDAGERLKIFRDFFREEEPPCVEFDLKSFAKKGHSFKDWIAPDSMEFYQDYFKINGRYGRVLYMQDYYSVGNLFAGLFGNQQIVTIAKGEIGASDGQKYWSWYGFSSYQEWCACFVSWCGEQAGLIESGAMPRFSLCSDGMSWFQSQGKWQAAGSTPTAGSLVFFDWGGDGVPDHVAIVEKCENGIVYTVEGNTSTRVNGESVRGVWQHQYPVSDQSILGYGTI